MTLYVNDNYEVKDVDETLDESLTPLEVDDETSPFIGWSKAKICCYRVNVEDGVVVMMTPYVDSRLIEHIDNIGRMSEGASELSNESIECLFDLAETMSEGDRQVSELARYVVNLEKRIKKLEEDK